MVYFTCNHCGASLKKNRVEQHYSLQCRNAISLSCIDCCKDFYADTWNAHTQCVSEQERYGGKDFQAQTPKGRKKQQDWMNLIQSAASSRTDLTKDEMEFFKALTAYDNIPQKKVKFENFVHNAFSNIKKPVVQRVWQVIEEEQQKVKAQGESHDSGTSGDANKSGDDAKHSNGTEENIPKDKQKSRKKQKKKRSTEENSSKQSEDEDADEVNGEGQKKVNQKKKKTKKISQSNGDPEIEGSAPEASEEKMKKHLTQESSGKEYEGESSDGVSGEECRNVSTKKKTKKNRKLHTTEVSQASSGVSDVEGDSENKAAKGNEVDSQGKNAAAEGRISIAEDAAQQESVDEKKQPETLSKKEIKKLKKKEKFEAQLKEIEQEATVEEAELPEVVEEEEKKSKKKQKKSATDEVSGTQLAESSLQDKDNVNGTTDEEEYTGAPDAEGVKKKFNFNDVVMQLLSKHDNELPLKRIEKKVLSEYEVVTGKSCDKLRSKFLKKLLRIPGVKMSHDTIKFVSSD